MLRYTFNHSDIVYNEACSILPVLKVLNNWTNLLLGLESVLWHLLLLFYEELLFVFSPLCPHVFPPVHDTTK